MTRPRKRRCLDCGTIVKMWDLDEPAICDTCAAERRREEKELNENRNDKYGHGALHVAKERGQ